MAHLEEAGRAAYLAVLAPGADLDHRGTRLSQRLLGELLSALYDDPSDEVRIGTARFEGATFTSRAWFESVTFTGDANFHEATFTGTAEFRSATFASDAWFQKVTFADDAQFNAVTVASDARFSGAQCETAPQLGPLRCGGAVWLDGAVFGAPVTVEIAARTLSLERARWQSTAALRLRYAEVHLAGAVLKYPVSLAAESVPFLQGHLSEEVLGDRDPRVRVMALGGVDAAHLALTDVDLSKCRFAGVVHLDQLRLEGRTTFASPPTGWHRHGPVPQLWSRRRTLAEEHHWRAIAGPAPGQQPPTGGWEPGPHHPDRARTTGPETVVAVYRQLRKSLEDGKNEPDAADFYYGECEMRRHDATRPWGERSLLTVYWALSGYGLRASRALAWLAAAMIVTIAVMVLWGLPFSNPKPQITGRQVVAGQQITLTADTPHPAKPTGPWTRRVTTERSEKALRVVINSVVFRSSGQNLTTIGTYTEMASRLAEPVLLGLAVLAVRSRVKR
ncbi:pentapeptide repeat-containing protein [Streptomyces sp. NPDC048723]|uniref:pentapeptide repeat-containing protein n=1 Tax=Streptomyces sp. NPDC048723 TaxID=3365589 RepID=UPI00371012F7